VECKNDLKKEKKSIGVQVIGQKAGAQRKSTEDGLLPAVDGNHGKKRKGVVGKHLETVEKKIRQKKRLKNA